MGQPVILFLYSPKNRLSLNALLGALSSTPLWTRSRVILSSTEEEILKFLSEDKNPVLVCFSSMTNEKKYRQDFLKSLSLHSKLFVCGGGPHVTAVPWDFAPWSTFLVQGEGEKTFLSLIQEFLEGDPSSFSTPCIIRGEKVNLDCFPSFPYKLGFLGPIEISRGCPFECAFCQTSTLFGRTMRHRSLDSIFEHVRGMMRHRKRIDLRFVTPNALAYGSEDGRTPNLKALEKLLVGLRKLLSSGGRIFFGSFPSEVRPEFVSREILDLLHGLVDNRNIVIGAQSGSERLLKLMRRGHTLEDVLSACEESTKRGFRVYVDFIFGCPGETEEDLLETVKFIQKLTEMGATIHAHAFLPLPGTPWERETRVPLPHWMKRFLGDLARKGKLSGQWQTQEKG